MMQVLNYVGWLYFETTVGNGNTTYMVFIIFRGRLRR